MQNFPYHKKTLLLWQPQPPAILFMNKYEAASLIMHSLMHLNHYDFLWTLQHSVKS